MEIEKLRIEPCKDCNECINGRYNQCTRPFLTNTRNIIEKINEIIKMLKTIKEVR